MPDFARSEFEDRLSRAQRAMREEGFDTLVFCSEAEVRYFSGFRTQFWQSPTRPWFLLLPADGEPVAIIPEIGAALMAETWVRDIRTWPSPRPDDEGLTLLRQALRGTSRVGLPMGQETALRMSLSDFDRLRQDCTAEFGDCTELVKRLRMRKSPAEIAIVRRICAIAGAAFARAGELFHVGQPLDAAFRAFRVALLQAGADDVPYLAGGAGQGGYGDVISPPSARALAVGDVLMLDTGATLNGYFCDFDRNFALGQADDAAVSAHERLWHATEAGLRAARPGATAADLFHAMHRVLGGGHSDVGRYGHGLGMQLTEWPSIHPDDATLLQPGMVITLEPSLTISEGRIMVHEENILIAEEGPELLTPRAPAQLPVLQPH